VGGFGNLGSGPRKNAILEFLRVLCHRRGFGLRHKGAWARNNDGMEADPVGWSFLRAVRLIINFEKRCSPGRKQAIRMGWNHRPTNQEPLRRRCQRVRGAFRQVMLTNNEGDVSQRLCASQGLTNTLSIHRPRPFMLKHAVANVLSYFFKSKSCPGGTSDFSLSIHSVLDHVLSLGRNLHNYRVSSLTRVRWLTSIKLMKHCPPL